MSKLDSVLDELGAGAPTDQANWEDVVARARRPRRVQLGFAGIAAAALLVLAAPAFGISGRLLDLFSGEPVSSDQLSQDQLHVLGAMSAGVSPRLDVSAKESLARVGAADLRRIATRDGRSYYVANTSRGGLCVTITYPGDPNPLISYECYPDFPSSSRPLLDRSVFAGSFEAPTVRLLEGFAADGVASVGLRTAGGAVEAKTDVENNVYYRNTTLPAEPIDEIVALDASGNVIYSFCLVRGGCR